MKKPSPMQFFFKMIAPFKLLIAGQIVVYLFWAFDLSFRPYLVKTMIDRIANLDAGNAFTLIGPIALGYIGMSLAITLMFRVYDHINLMLNPSLKSYVGQFVVQKMLKHSQKFFNQNTSGNITNKIKDVSNSVPEILRILLEQFTSTVLAIGIALVFLFETSPIFALGLAAWVSLYIIGSVYMTRVSADLSRAAAESRSLLTGFYVDLFNNIMTVRLFSGYKKEKKLTEKALDQMVQSERKKDKFFLKLFFFQGTSFVLYQGLSLLFLIKGLNQGSISGGDFALILTINIEIVHTLWLFARDLSDFANTMGMLEQGLDVVYHQNDVLDKEGAIDLAVQKGEIHFKNVCFGHKSNRYLFDKINVTIPAGQKVGLVGFSGGGKTTFVNLLLRLYQIDEGSILIDGQDIAAVTQDSLRKSISFIPQEPGLFNRSLLDNLLYAKPDATMADIKLACQKAKADDFIKNLTNQYETSLGERGSRLSGGQRQRVAIARAILKNSPILILDEATSALDSITEQDIQESFHALMADKTTFVIAHRLSTLQKMDRILVFDNGVIVQDGTHAELVQKQGLYHQLWSAQVEGLLQSESNSELDNTQLSEDV